MTRKIKSRKRVQEERKRKKTGMQTTSQYGIVPPTIIIIVSTSIENGLKLKEKQQSLSI